MANCVFFVSTALASLAKSSDLRVERIVGLDFGTARGNSLRGCPADATMTRQLAQESKLSTHVFRSDQIILLVECLTPSPMNSHAPYIVAEALATRTQTFGRVLA
jgi:hypothetical protein